MVGDRVGTVDYELGILRESDGAFANGCPAPRTRPTRARPLHFGYSTGGGLGMSRAEDPVPGRIARRTVRGRLVIDGTAHPDVRSITIATPRDVRTIVPSRRARAFLLVYEGGFPTGEITMTARFADGTTRRERFAPGM